MLSIEEILNKVYGGDLSTIPRRLLCLDPGETTGWALFVDGKLTEWGQADTFHKDTKCINWAACMKLMEEQDPTTVICENYRVYEHKLDRHSYSEVPTLRIIGGFELLCFQGLPKWESDDPTPGDLIWTSIPIFYQMASQAKGFITDEKLKAWGLWKEGMKHSRDAIRHGLYYLIITNKPKV